MNTSKQAVDAANRNFPTVTLESLEVTEIDTNQPDGTFALVPLSYLAGPFWAATPVGEADKLLERIRVNAEGAMALSTLPQHAFNSVESIATDVLTLQALAATR